MSIFTNHGSTSRGRIASDGVTRSSDRRPSPAYGWRPSPDHARRHPISRWYLLPIASRLAAMLVPTRVRPVHCTLVGVSCAGAAALMLACRPELAACAAGFVLAAWLADRVDGELARRQHTASAWGAWLDGNVDEFSDVALHVAVSAAAVSSTGSQTAWLLLAAFLGGKYLFFHGMVTERACAAGGSGAASERASDADERHVSRVAAWGRAAYHLPGNADVRIHLLVVALLTGQLGLELALVAFYYNLRWIVRYGLVARRLGGSK